MPAFDDCCLACVYLCYRILLPVLWIVKYVFIRSHLIAREIIRLSGVNHAGACFYRQPVSLNNRHLA